MTDGWYSHIFDWKQFNTSLSLNERMKRSIITGLHDDADGTQDVGAFFVCDHAKHMHKAMPWERLVEIDIKDKTTTTLESCWWRCSTPMRYAGAT